MALIATLGYGSAVRPGSQLVGVAPAELLWPLYQVPPFATYLPHARSHATRVKEGTTTKTNHDPAGREGSETSRASRASCTSSVSRAGTGPGAPSGPYAG